MANFTFNSNDRVDLRTLSDEAHLARIAAAEETIRISKAIMHERKQPVATPGAVDAVLRELEGRDA